jgi:hypothetical protein
MSFFGSLFGTDQAAASKAAAQDTYNKQIQASQALTNAGNTANQGYQALSQKFQPYEAVGGAAVDPLTRLLQDPNSVSQLPGYQFDFNQGVNALDRSAAARGRLNSGRQSKDLLRFGTGLADNTLQQQYGRLLGGAQFGLGATGQDVNTQGAGLNAQLGAATGAAGQQFNAAPTIGQGDVAAATAQTQALQNLINAGAYAIGGGAGGGGGGALKMLTSFIPK